MLFPTWRKTCEMSSFENILAFLIEQGENQPGPLCRKWTSRFMQGSAGRCNHVSLHPSRPSTPAGIPLLGEQVVELHCPPLCYGGKGNFKLLSGLWRSLASEAGWSKRDMARVAGMCEDKGYALQPFSVLVIIIYSSLPISASEWFDLFSSQCWKLEMIIITVFLLLVVFLSIVARHFCGGRSLITHMEFVMSIAFVQRWVVLWALGSGKNAGTLWFSLWASHTWGECILKMISVRERKSIRYIMSMGHYVFRI